MELEQIRFHGTPHGFSHEMWKKLEVFDHELLPLWSVIDGAWWVVDKGNLWRDPMWPGELGPEDLVEAERP